MRVLLPKLAYHEYMCFSSLIHSPSFIFPENYDHASRDSPKATKSIQHNPWVRIRISHQLFQTQHNLFSASQFLRARSREAKVSRDTLNDTRTLSISLGMRSLVISHTKRYIVTYIPEQIRIHSH